MIEKSWKAELSDKSDRGSIYLVRWATLLYIVLASLPTLPLHRSGGGFHQMECVGGSGGLLGGKYLVEQSRQETWYRN